MKRPGDFWTVRWYFRALKMVGVGLHILSFSLQHNRRVGQIRSNPSEIDPIIFPGLIEGELPPRTSDGRPKLAGHVRAVESNFSWYWLVDGLREVGYPIELANPAKIQQYNGLKHADDQDDAYHLAELQRLKILPKTHVYDPELRPVRDLLLRRTSLVHQRTALLLSFKSLYVRRQVRVSRQSSSEVLRQNRFKQNRTDNVFST